MTADQKQKRASSFPEGAPSVHHSTLSPRPARSSSFQHRNEPDGRGGPERWTSSVAPPEVEAFGELASRDGSSGADPAAGDWDSREQREAPPPPAWAAGEPGPGSAGYYSFHSGRLDEVEIPPAPRVPNLALDDMGPDLERDRRPMDVFDLERVAHSKSASGLPLGTLPASARESRSWLPTNEGEFPATEPPPIRRYVTGLPSAPLAVHSSAPIRRVDYQQWDEPPAQPPRLYFSPHVRQQAGEWAATGSLSLPGCSSPRHARAVQRALLLALLTEPGWHNLPQGLRQRAGWLFCLDWDTSPAVGHPFREADDLATVLSMPATEESRGLLRDAVAAVLPAFAARASRPPPRRSSRPPRSSPT